jgi:hypothetical protein
MLKGNETSSNKNGFIFGTGERPLACEILRAILVG